MESKRFGVWKCATCGAEARATVHQLRKTYCSSQCMATGYVERLRGEANPNYRAASKRVCAHCQCEYASYKKTRKFCSHKCAMAARPKAFPKKQFHLRLVKPAPAPRQKRVRSERACLQCGTTFQFYPSQTRRYCSYACHLASGGAFRAGMASSKATMKYGAKKDANHNEIFEELRKHCAVYDFSAAGCGLPDGIAWVAEQWRLFDVKNPKTGYGRRGLNKVQKRWLSQWKGGPVYLIYTADEASRFGVGNLDGIKSVWPEEALRAIGAIA